MLLKLKEMPKDGALKQPGSEVTSGGEGGVSRGSLCPELVAVQEGVGVATSLAWRALYTTLQGPNKCGNLLRKGLSGPPLALRSEDLWDKTSIHHELCRGPVNSHPNGNRTQQDSVAASLPSRQPCSPGAAKGRAGPQGGVGGEGEGRAAPLSPVVLKPPVRYGNQSQMAPGIPDPLPQGLQGWGTAWPWQVQVWRPGRWTPGRTGHTLTVARGPVLDHTLSHVL